MDDMKPCKRCGQMMIGNGRICIKCVNEVWDMREAKEEVLPSIKESEKRKAPPASDYGKK